MNFFSKPLITGSVCAFLALGSLATHAESVTTVTADAMTETVKRTVSVADLDLTTPEAQEILYYRLSRAAEQVCGSDDLRVAGSLAQATRNRDCYEDSLSRAIAEVSNSALAAAN